MGLSDHHFAQVSLAHRTAMGSEHLLHDGHIVLDMKQPNTLTQTTHLCCELVRLIKDDLEHTAKRVFYSSLSCGYLFLWTTFVSIVATARVKGVGMLGKDYQLIKRSD